ncbi:MAG: NAD(P)/FAD-dependent oxidoreductase, partial [Bacteroidota bacterium]
GVFAMGDVAEVIENSEPQRYPMLAPVAMQQGKLLGRNIKAILKGKELKAFKYSDKGIMATVGRNKAVVEVGALKIKGFIAWVIWMSLHLMTLVGFRNRVVVFVNWMYNYFYYDRSLRMIIEDAPEKKEETIAV